MFASKTPSLVRLFATIGLVMSCAVVGCRAAKPEPQKPPPPTVTVTRPGTASVQSYHDYNGYLDAVETVEIRARVKGFLTEVKFVEGEEIAVGKELYKIDDREYKAGVAKADADILKAEADIVNAEAQVKLAVAEEVRQRGLYETSSGSKTDFDKAVATLAANRATVKVGLANKASAESAKRTAELQLEYTDIRSPIAGRINRTLVTRGNLVGQNETTLLTTIVSVDPLYVYFDAPERDFVEAQRALKDAARPLVSLPVAVGIATEVGYPHTGHIDFRENRVDTGTGTVRVRGRIPNPVVPPGNARMLYPGLYARVRVPNGDRKDQLVIPEEALMTGQEGRFIYVIGTENIVQKRTVTVGPNVWRAAEHGSTATDGWVLNNPNPARPAAGPVPPAGPGGPPTPLTKLPVRSMVAIEKGLEPGDLVIVNGLQRSRPGAPVTPDRWDLQPPPK